MADNEPSSSAGPSTRPQPPSSPRYHFDPVTMAPFRIMMLPLLPRKAILKQWNISPILELTMTSQKFKASTYFCNLKFGSFRLIFGNYSNIINICNKNYPSMMLSMCCKHTEPETEWVEKRINGEKVLMTKPDRVDRWGAPIELSEMNVLAETEDKKWELLQKATDHVMSVAKAGELEVECYRGWDQRNQFIWNLKPKIEKIEIRVWPEPNLNYPWMSFDVILPKDTTCKKLTFQSYVLPFVAINRMFKEWIAGKNEDLEDLIFVFPEHNDVRNDAPCFEGINTQQTFYTNMKIDLCRFNYYYLRSPVVDVKRVTDGRLATIVSAKHTVGLYVWHEKHLEKYRKAVAEWEEERERKRAEGEEEEEDREERYYAGVGQNDDDAEEEEEEDDD